MKKKIFVTCLIVLGFSLVILVNAGSWKKVKNEIQEIPASETQREEMDKVLNGLADIYNRKGASALETLFSYSRGEREAIKCVEGEDPVETGVAVLKRHGRKIAFSETEILTLRNAQHRFYIDTKVNDESLLRFSIDKSKSGYKLISIVER